MKKQGFLSVGNLHQLYYETQGNKEGIPVLFLHGGPGGNTNPRDLDFFDLDKFFVILFDQRGTGKSKPFGALEHNTTQYLIEDCKQLLDFLHIEKALLFGGSWGSTLSLLFSIAYPTYVSGMILRGVFLATKASRAFCEQGLSKQEFPQKWERLKSLVPESHVNQVLEYYQDQILKGDPDAQYIHAYEWERYCLSLSIDGITDEVVKSKMESFNGAEKVRLLMYYTQHDFFIPENHILDNTQKIPAVPISIVHGKNDWLCRPNFAELLQENLPSTTLHLVEGGHSAYDPAISVKLKEVLNGWK